MKLNIAVAFGGKSVEHEISVLSAIQVMSAISDDYEIFPLYIAKDGRMFCEEELKSLDTFSNIEQFTLQHQPVTLVRRDANVYLVPARKHFFEKERRVDLVIPVLHGTNGEDGSFQGYLQTLGIPYTGCSVLAGAIGQDKVIMKQILQDSGLRVVPWFYWSRNEKMEEDFFKKAQRLGYPLVVKPANLGSSIGIKVVNNDSELHVAMMDAYEYDHKVLIEKKIEPLREINISLLGDEEHCICSMLEEVLKQDDILSFENKYIGKHANKGMINTSRKLPADLSEEQIEEIQRMAKETFYALNASGVVRIDFLMQKDSEVVYINEINSIPGSLSYYLWKKDQMNFTTLIEELIQLAFKRKRNEDKKVYSFSSNILKEWKHGGKMMK
ncbi:D-alanine--D-alanine ligase family protein [Erysipelotrichaceae bacterium HCN-30851]|mgnify:CR=1 FL=1